MIHRWFVAFAIYVTPSLSVAQEPQPAQQPIDAKATTQAIDAGIGWLLRHQDETGGWSASEFVRHDPKTDLCTGIGKPDQDIPVTALATLALMARGNTNARGGPNAGSVQKAFRWLETQMQADGFVGAREASNAVVGHAMSCAVLGRGKLRSSELPQPSLECLLALRLPDGTWSARPGATKGDPIATFWACMACFHPAFGNGGKMEPALEAMQQGALATASTPAVEATLRWFAQHERTTDKRLGELMGVLGGNLPQWRTGPDAARMDFLDWIVGTYAVSEGGGAMWQQWGAALQAALVVHQRTDGAHAGSWDPVDKNGKEGGRVYATAVNVMSLSVVSPISSPGRRGGVR